MIEIATADIPDYDLESTFPNDLVEALPVVELNDELNESLGRDFVDVFVSVKRTKLRDYMKMMTQ
jgi:glutamine synthetase|tara:strand:- start:47 stop:241 length:195 start_codon:yes stop_codon:yes gene_type:complete